MATIELSRVRKVYSGGVEAIKGIDLSIDAGQMAVLVGPSGCGKSTLLRMIAGLETITDGTISIAGREVNRLEPAERDIAMVFQNYALYPHMTVRQNMAYGLKNRGKGKAEIEERVAEASRILQIGDYLDRKPRQLSGGQRQRVAMGRAIVREPKAFLFDEPLSNLDAKLRVEMRGEIKQLQRRLGTTSVYVTHDQLEAMTLADKLVVLNGGRIEQVGAPLEVYRRPASVFVASFIGSPAMNLLPATSDGAVLSFGCGRMDLAGRRAPEGEITVGMRAEDVMLKRPNGATAMPLAISYVEELGAERLVHGTQGDARVVVAVPSDHELADTMEMAVDPGALHFFDSGNGRRLPDR